jgi:hypothetical protein
MCLLNIKIVQYSCLFSGVISIAAGCYIMFKLFKRPDNWRCHCIDASKLKVAPQAEFRVYFLAALRSISTFLLLARTYLRAQSDRVTNLFGTFVTQQVHAPGTFNDV